MNDQNIRDFVEDGVLDQSNAVETETLVKKYSQQRKFRLLLWMVVVFAVSGAITGISPDGSKFSQIVDFASAVVFFILILRWCEYDRWERQITRWRFFTPLMVLFPGPLIMVPTYLLATRGVRGLLAIAKAGVFFLLLITVFVVTAIASNFLFL